MEPAAAPATSTCRSRRAREISHLDRVDDDQAARKFFRPKGSVTLGWRPSQGLGRSLKLRRRVGQISFYDFLAQPKLSEDRENAGNPDLVPPQSWEVETEVAPRPRRLGQDPAATLHYYRVEDIVDVIPIGDDGEGIGNLPRADRIGFESVSTHQVRPDRLERRQARLDARPRMDLGADPLTGDKRPISGVRDAVACGPGPPRHSRHPARVGRLCAIMAITRNITI